MRPKETISAFDGFLAQRRLTLDAVVVGGAALGLLGVIKRETRDCDILHPTLYRMRFEKPRSNSPSKRASEAKDWATTG